MGESKDMTDFEKALEAEKPEDLHFRTECEGFRCGAHKSWLEGARWARDYTLKEQAAHAPSDLQYLLKELKQTKNALQLTGEGRPSEWAYTQLLNDFKMAQKELAELKAENQRLISMIKG
jgi:hypothetical protein